MKVHLHLGNNWKDRDIDRVIHWLLLSLEYQEQVLYFSMALLGFGFVVELEFCY
jgi:hypothetical protein